MEPLPQTPGLPAALPTARYVRHRDTADYLGTLTFPAELVRVEFDGEERGRARRDN